MRNLLTETREAIHNSGHSTQDIIFIGAEQSGYSCTWDQFVELADRQYDSGYGGQEVARDLIIVFSDKTKMWRGEYDGSEWWEYSDPFVMPAPDKIKRLETVFTTDVDICGWCDLEEIHKKD